MTTFIIAALTADGFIAQETKQTPLEWRSEGDRSFFISATKRAGVCILGSTTFNSMRRPMPGRLHIVYSMDKTEKDNQEGIVEYTKAPPADVLRDLKKRGYKEVAVCGGATIYTMFMEAGVVDKLYLTIEPVVFGSGIKLFNKELDASLELASSKKIGEHTVLLEYNVIR